MNPQAIITGATHGIGNAIAEEFLKNGYDIVVCSRNLQELEFCKSTWEMKYPTAEVFICETDLSKKADVVNFVQKITIHFNNIQVLVNNAGIFIPGDLVSENDEQLIQMIDINLLSVYNLTRFIVPVFLEKNKGHIFNISSVAALKAYQHGGAYSISKYALQGFSDNLREELKDTPIKVTSINPGATYSRSWLESGVPRERIMEANDIAKMVFVCTTLSSQALVEQIIMRPQKGDL